MPSDMQVSSQRMHDSQSAAAHDDSKARVSDQDQPSQQAQQSQQTQDAQAQEAAATQQKQAADQAKAAQAQTEKNYSLTSDFMNTFQTMFQEGYEANRVPQADQGAGVNADTRGPEAQRDQQVIREFIREAQRLMVSDQNLEIGQIVLRIKAEQGGVFWQKVEQALQRGMNPLQLVTFQKLQKDAGEIKPKFGAPEIPVAGEKGAEAGKLMQNQAGRAMLELIKAEINPNSQLDGMILILQLLQREGMKDSSQKLISYMKNRYGLSEDEMERFLREHQLLPYYMGPMPREEKGAKSQGTLWYIFISLLVVPAVALIGMDWVWAVILGIATLGFLLILTAQRN